MIFIRRDRTVTDQHIALRVGLFFFAAGLWLAGVLSRSSLVTAVAIGVVLLAMVISVVGRWRAGGQEGEEEESPEADA